MMTLTVTSALTALVSLVVTLLVMNFMAKVLKTKTTDLKACFLCVMSTSLIMAIAIHFTPSGYLQAEHMQFLIATAVSAVVYHVFLDTTIIKSIFLAATNFMVQIFTLLGFGLAVSVTHAGGFI